MRERLIRAYKNYLNLHSISQCQLFLIRLYTDSTRRYVAVDAMLSIFSLASCVAGHSVFNMEAIMTQLEKILYTGKTHTTGGRDGAARSSDGRLDIALSLPGSTRSGTNPEQLFGAGWSACFIGAMGLAAAKMKLALPADVAVDAEVDLGTTDGAFFLQVRMNVSLPGLERNIAQVLVDSAHQNCPYSKATRGNINVAIRLI
jgi:osmotically inducible protein OsmC